jgi:hypothetical protein
MLELHPEQSDHRKNILQLRISRQGELFSEFIAVITQRSVSDVSAYGPNRGKLRIACYWLIVIAEESKVRETAEHAKVQIKTSLGDAQANTFFAGFAVHHNTSQMNYVTRPSTHVSPGIKRI